MWENLILFLERNDVLKYSYKFKKKSFGFIFNFMDENVDGYERSIGWGCV